MKKINKITAVFTAIFIIIANVAFFDIFAAEDPNIKVTASLKGDVLPGKTFKIEVKVKNIAEPGVPLEISVKQSDNSKDKIFILTSEPEIQTAVKNEEKIFSFEYYVSAEAASTSAADIAFSISYEAGGLTGMKTERIGIRVNEPAAPPATEPPTNPPAVIPSAPGGITIESVSVNANVSEKETFYASVTVKNGNSYKVNSITVSTDTSNSGIGLESYNKFTENIEANSTAVYNFIYKAQGAGQTQIKFTVKSGETEITSDIKTITVRANAAAEQPKPHFEIFSALHPQRVETGGTMKLSIRFAAVGTMANQVSVKIEPPEGFEPTRPAVIPIGPMAAGINYICDFEFEITDKAAAGYNEFKINISSSDIPSLTDYPVGIIVEKSGQTTDKNLPDIKIIPVNIPESVEKGDEFEIKAVIENSGAEANDVEITMSAPAGISTMSMNKLNIGTLGKGESKEILFSGIVEKSADEWYNLIELKIEYKYGENGESKTGALTQRVGFNVPGEGAKDFSIFADIPSGIKPGSDFTVSVTVKNNGKDAKNLTITAVPQLGGVENRTNGKISIPEIDSGKSVTAEIVFNVPESAAGKYCSFEITLLENGMERVKQFAGTSVAEADIPKITIESLKMPQTVNIGDIFNIELTIKNSGGAEAENIIFTLSGPNGILNRTANTVKTDSLASGKKETKTFEFIATQAAGYGYKPFNLKISYSSKSKTVNDEIEQYLGLTVNSSDLKIESVKIPNSVGVNYDFNVEIAVKNTGADTNDVTLVLNPQGGLINKTSNTVKIDSIKSGETIVKTFIFMAPEASPSGYAAIDITISHGEQTFRQYSGTFVSNPKKEDEPEKNADIPVVIINKFSYVNIETDEDTGTKNDTEAGMFKKTAIAVASPAPAPAFPDAGMEINPGAAGGQINTPAPKDINAVYGGNTFIFAIELLNTHKSVGVKDLKITISSISTQAQPGGIFNPKSGSNTFFVEYLGPDETVEKSIELIVKSDAAPDSYGLTINLSYKNENGVPANSEEIINIPVQQEMRFSIGDLPPIGDIEMGDDAYVNVQFGNLGKSLIYNAIVRAQGDGFTNQEGTYYAGNIEAGKFLAKEFMLTPFTAGFINGSFVFTYEDADGNIYQEEQPFSFNVAGGENMEGEMPFFPDNGGMMIDPGGMPVTGEEEQAESGGFWLFTEMNLLKWGIIAAGGLLIAGGIITVVIVVKKRAKKKNKDVDEEDDF